MEGIINPVYTIKKDWFGGKTRVGEFKNGKLHGYGEVYQNTTENTELVKKGTFQNGILINGEQKFFKVKNWWYIGELKDELPFGKGEVWDRSDTNNPVLVQQGEFGTVQKGMLWEGKYRVGDVWYVGNFEYTENPAFFKTVDDIWFACSGSHKNVNFYIQEIWYQERMIDSGMVQKYSMIPGRFLSMDGKSWIVGNNGICEQWTVLDMTLPYKKGQFCGERFVEGEKRLVNLLYKGNFKRIIIRDIFIDVLSSGTIISFNGLSFEECCEDEKSLDGIITFISIKKDKTMVEERFLYDKGVLVGKK